MDKYKCKQCLSIIIKQEQLKSKETTVISLCDTVFRDPDFTFPMYFSPTKKENRIYFVILWIRF